MTLETVDINDLQAHPRNYRGHPAEQIAHLKASLAEYGIVKNIVVASDNVILAGHGLVHAARELGYTELPVCRIAMPSTDPKAQKFLIIDNEISRKSLDDTDQLAALLKELQDSQDLTGTGYDSDEVTQLLNDLQAEEFGAGLNEDAGPEEPPIEPVTRLGDIWVMGEHRLVCGDCTEVGAWESCKPGSFLMTDPPYSVNYASRKDNPDNTEQSYREGGDPTELIYGFLSIAPVTAGLMTYPVDRHLFALANAFNNAGWELKKELVWVKQAFTFWPGAHYQQQHEPILVMAKRGSIVPWFGPGNASTVQEFPRQMSNDDHPTPRPVELWEKLMSFHTQQGDMVSDCFMGSGTTLIACEQINRICYGIELEPRYVDVAVKRWQKLTGKQAILESTGEAFSGE